MVLVGAAIRTQSSIDRLTDPVILLPIIVASPLPQPPKVQQKTKEQKLAAAMAGGKSKKKVSGRWTADVIGMVGLGGFGVWGASSSRRLLRWALPEGLIATESRH